MNAKVYTGSAKQLANKVAINGKPVSAPVLSILSSLGIVKITSKETPVGGKGKKINVLKLESGTVQLEVTDYTGPVMADTSEGVSDATVSA